MLFTVDVGNTNIVLGIFEGSDLLASWRIRTDRERTTDEHGMLFKHLLEHSGFRPGQIDGAIISNVVPPMMQTLEDTARKYFEVEPLVVGHGVQTGIRIHYRPESDVGADRIVNAVAAFEMYGGPAIVVDFGTATTFDAISGEGHYLGGAIAPGIGISMEALFRQAARLPRIELVPPENVIGETTIMSMQSGVLYGFVGQVEGIVARFRKELGGRAQVIATGGFAALIGRETPCLEIVDPLLTLHGLRILFDRNRGI
ncbi:MAG: type III pantothenate kinase [Armatimonadetes bacterium]|nr:type III pantothenate kinase [Armatimonadota bacterium]